MLELTACLYATCNMCDRCDHSWVPMALRPVISRAVSAFSWKRHTQAYVGLTEAFEWTLDRHTIPCRCDRETWRPATAGATLNFAFISCVLFRAATLPLMHGSHTVTPLFSDQHSSCCTFLSFHIPLLLLFLSNHSPWSGKQKAFLLVNGEMDCNKTILWSKSRIGKLQTVRDSPRTLYVGRNVPRSNSQTRKADEFFRLLTPCSLS